MNTYDWSILRMICNTVQNGESNVVVRIRWNCKATKGDYSISKSDFCNVTYDPANQFIAYNDLTESQVLDWVWSVIDKSQIEAKLAEGLADKPASVVLPLPWTN